ncbi:hypothetical protein [Tepidimonas sp. HKU78]|uniref:type IV pilus assembly protein FimV n=1 Tax=Tepidimonas sp. HKU78 TaxID=3414504 RepID=UPI003CF33868
MHTKSALASLLLVSAVNGHAQTLGAAQGAVIIGRPLDIVVQSPGLASDDATALCVQAEVRYGETRLGPSDVSVRLEPQVGQRDGAIRVQARPAVNEPFVTVEVRIGCPSRFVRVYTMLADVESPIATPAVVAAVDVPETRDALSVPAARPQRISTIGRDLATNKINRRASAAKTRPMGLQPSARPTSWFARLSLATGVPLVAPANDQGSPRLDVQPLAFTSDEDFFEFLLARARRDLGVDNAPVERSGASGSTAADARGRGVADAEPVGPESELQREVLTLREERTRLYQRIEELGQELSQAQAEIAVGQRVLLGMFAAVALVVAAWLARDRWRRLLSGRLRKSDQWWIPRGSGRQEIADAQPITAKSDNTNKEAVAVSVIGDSLDFPDVDSIPSEKIPPFPPGALTAETNQGIGMVREPDSSLITLDVAALHDLWEQVDFFDSLGQAGDAIAALSAFVRAHPRASEAPYLRWWTLARRHGLDSRTLQTLYEQHYHRLLVVDDADAGLEADAALMQALTATWPGEQARAIVVAALASQPGDPGSPLHVRTLAAFDDLITLHGVLDLLPVLGPMPEATAMKAGGDAVPGVAAAASAALAPTAAGLDLELPDIAEVVPPSEAVGDTTSATPGADEGLDFDLSGWEPPAESKAPPRG